MGTYPDQSAQWAAAGQLASTAAGAYASATMNRATRKWNEAQYAKQRADALADWTMQNEYNSPQEQMKRLKMAGLNPNLIYGKGAGDMTSGAVRSSDTPAWNPKTPDYSGIGDSLMKYMQAKQMDAQIDNLRAQNTVILQDQMLKKAQTIATDVAGRRGQVALENDPIRMRLENRLNEISYDVKVNQISNMMNQWQLSQEQLDIIKQTKPATIQMAVERILNMQMERAKDEAQRDMIREQIKNVQNSQTLQQLEIDLKKNGVTWSDALWQRVAATVLGEAGVKIK